MNEQAADPEAAKQTKPRRKANPRAKLDAERLLGPTGFPRLLAMARKIKPSGSDLRDLDKIITTYQFWAQDLFPKLLQTDFLKQTEKICTQRPLKNYMRELIADEKRQKIGVYATESNIDSLNPWNMSDSDNELVETSRNIDVIDEFGYDNDFGDEVFMVDPSSIDNTRSALANSLFPLDDEPVKFKPSTILKAVELVRPAVALVAPTLVEDENTVVFSAEAMGVIELNRQRALQKLQIKQNEKMEAARVEMECLEREKKELDEMEVARMIADAGPFMFSD